MTNSKHPINMPPTCGDLKMRVPDSKSYIAMMQAMGATVVAVDLSELYLALSQGVADGQDTPPPVVQSNKILRGAEIRLEDGSRADQLRIRSSTRNSSTGCPRTSSRRSCEPATKRRAGCADFTQEDEKQAYDFLDRKEWW